MAKDDNVKLQRNLLATAITGGLIGAAQPVEAATITVDTNSDAAIIIGGSGCTLRLVVLAANTNAAVSDCAAGSPVDVDVIEFDNSLSGSTVTLQQGEIPITSSLTIEGQPGGFGRPITISANNASRIFNIDDGDNFDHQAISLRDVIIQDGPDYLGGGLFNHETLTIESSTLRANTATSAGGAINNVGTLLLNGCSITENRTSGAFTTGGGLSNSGPYFGGPADNYIGHAELLDTTVSNNTAALGGGISNAYGSLVITGGAVSDNRSNTSGGAISNSGSLELDGVVLDSNSADSFGGAIATTLQSATITSSLLTGNTAGTTGGAIAVYLTSLTISETTIGGNTANSGGGISVGPDTTVTLSASTLSSNYSGNFGGAVYTSGNATLNAKHSTMSGNTSYSGALFFDSEATATLTNISVKNSDRHQISIFLQQRSALSDFRSGLKPTDCRHLTRTSDDSSSLSYRRC